MPDQKKNTHKSQCMVCLNNLKNNEIVCKHSKGERQHGICKNCNVKSNILKSCPIIQCVQVQELFLLMN